LVLWYTEKGRYNENAIDSFRVVGSFGVKMLKIAKVKKEKQLA